MPFVTLLRDLIIAPVFVVRGLAGPLSWVFTTLKLAVLLCLTLFLSGCSLGSLPSFGGDFFGSSKKEQVVQPNKGLSEERLLAAAKLDASTDGAIDASTASLCSKFKIWDADKFLTVYNVGQYGDGLAVRYRGELTKAARECAFQPGLVHVKYGFAGRVLLGPKGQAGVVNLPVLIHLTDEKGKKIKTEKLTVPVTIEPGKPIGYFSVVKKMDIQLQGGKSGRNYRVFVGFERQDQS